VAAIRIDIEPNDARIEQGSSLQKILERELNERDDLRVLVLLVYTHVDNLVAEVRHEENLLFCWIVAPQICLIKILLITRQLEFRYREVLLAGIYLEDCTGFICRSTEVQLGRN
jgi:hypothetical protein